MVKGIVKVSIFTLAVGGAIFILRDYFLLEQVHRLALLLVLFFWAQHIILLFLTDFLKKNLDVDTPLLALGTIAARLITALFAFLAMVMLGVESKVIFAVNFSVLYLLYQVFEIIAVLSNLRRNSRQDQNR